MLRLKRLRATNIGSPRSHARETQEWDPLGTIDCLRGKLGRLLGIPDMALGPLKATTRLRDVDISTAPVQYHGMSSRDSTSSTRQKSLRRTNVVQHVLPIDD